jgi:aminoglycoside phosphotransferase (APT) family kinase protein
MSLSPWKSDYPLAPDAAAKIIAGCFPDVDATTPRFIGSGWHFDVLLTSDSWVFRFPRHGWCATLFDAEARAHRLVAGRLPAHVTVPRVELVGPPTLGYPYKFAGHRFISGVQADALPNELLPRVAREIATTLGGLHSIPTIAARAVGIAEYDANADGPQEWFEHGVAAAKQLTGIDPVVDRAVHWLNQLTRSTQPEGGPLHLTHGDFSPENILVNPTTGALTGILDWSDTTLGDAARDLVFLATWQGWPFVEQVLGHYPHCVDSEFRTRLRSMAQMLSTVHLAYAHEAGWDLAPHIRSVRNVFGPTQ